MIKKYEQSLNDSFSENSTDELICRFEYMLNKNREKPIRRSTLISHIANGTVGTMIRKYDSIAFYVGYRESAYYRS
jgi:hypothetical protein